MIIVIPSSILAMFPIIPLDEVITKITGTAVIVADQLGLLNTWGSFNTEITETMYR